MAKTLPLTLFVDWPVDGALLPLFKEEGYPGPIWRAGTVRHITRELARRAKQSGAVLEVPEPGQREDNYREPGPAVTVSPNETVQALRAKYAGEPWRTVMSEHHFVDGTLSPEFAAVDRPPEIGEHEIVKLPRSLVEKCLSSGAVFTDDPETIEQFSGAFQVRFTNNLAPVSVWRREQAERAQAQQAKQARVEASGRRAELRAQAIAKIVKACKLTAEEAEALEFLA